MCMTKGAPKKPAMGPCGESHGGGITFGSSYITLNSGTITTTAAYSGDFTSTTAGSSLYLDASRITLA